MCECRSLIRPPQSPCSRRPRRLWLFVAFAPVCAAAARRAAEPRAPASARLEPAHLSLTQYLTGAHQALVCDSARLMAADVLPVEERAVDGFVPQLDERRLVFWVERGGAARTTWTDPRLPLPLGYIERKDERGVSYFLNTRRGTVDAHGDMRCEPEPDPRPSWEAGVARRNDLPLPAGVVPRLSADDRVVFLDREAGTQTTTDPRLARLAANELRPAKVQSRSDDAVRTRASPLPPVRAGASASAWQDEYEPVRQIGSGSFAKVLLVRRRGGGADSGSLWCMKVTPLRRGLIDRGSVLREARLHVSLHHPHIVRCWRSYESPTSVAVLLDLYEHGTLHDLVRQQVSQDAAFPAVHLAIWLGQLSSALAYLHDRSLLHNDIKPENILLRLDASNESTLAMALSDFGLSVRVTRTIAKKAQEYWGSPSFSAPEVLCGQQASQASDVWSLAGTLLYCMTGGTPLGIEVTSRAQFDEQRASIVARARAGAVRPVPELYAGKLGDAVQLALRRAPAKRPSASDLAREFAVE